MSKFFFVALPSADAKTVTAAIEAGATAIMVPNGNAKAVKTLGKISVIAQDGDMVPGKDIEIMKITKKEDEAKIVALHGKIPTIIENLDWTIIPLENLISKTTNLVQSVKNEKEARLALTTMERGADGVCLFSEDPNVIKAVGNIVRELETPNIPLVTAKIVSITPVEMSDRCCIDTTSLLPPGEGLLVGDSAKAMFLVHNENVQSPYCDPRPFRVNAGAVHAYILLPDNRTKYLCELSAGSTVLAVNPQGNGRIVAVGRNKIERRPMLLITAESEGKKISLVLQNAETIRLTTPTGKPISVTKLNTGDEVLAYLGSAHGRHFGTEIQETITEQ
ncbi:MAG: 3-dehydroquinate synthase II [Candidatus Peregrinibacteria bacterium]